MAAVIKAILLDPDARGSSVADPNYGKLREPVVDVVAILRALNQYGATLGRWLGLTPGQLAIALPNLANFPTKDLGFLV